MAELLDEAGVFADADMLLSTSTDGFTVGTSIAVLRDGRVQVRVDEGPWTEATLTPQYSVDTWRQWSWKWSALPGNHTLQVRAIDGTGELQTEQRAQPIPDGASGWHARHQPDGTDIPTRNCARHCR